MWKSFARRALIEGQAAAQRLPPRVVGIHQELVTLPSSQSISPSFPCSRKWLILQSQRFFSSNQAEIDEEPSPELPISEGNEIDGGLDFIGNAKSELENEGSVFDDAEDGLETSGGFPGERFDRMDATVENLESGVVEAGDLGTEKKNDPEKVESLLSLLQSRGTVTGSLESTFEEMDLVLHEDFVLHVLETSNIPGESLISFFGWAITKPEFKLTAPVLDVLVSAICIENKRKVVYALWDLLKENVEKIKGEVRTETLNELIAEFFRLRKGKAAFEVFNKFEEFGCHLNADTYFLTIESLCKNSFHDWACLVSERMIGVGELPDADKVGKIISYLCVGRQPKDAYLVYMAAKDKNIDLPQSSITSLIVSLCRIKKPREGAEEESVKESNKETVSLALKMLNDYSPADRKYAINPFSRVIQKLCWIEDVDRATKLLHEMIESGPPPGNEVFNYVISGLAKAEDLDEALKMKNLMQKRGLKPDVYTYSVIISGFARGGEMEEASKVFDEAKKKHSQLSAVTFHSLIRGYCKLEQFDKAIRALGEMKQYGVRPTHDEYNKLIKSVCFKASDWETAEKLLEQMNESGLVLNGRTRALISAVRELDQETSTELSTSA